MLHSDGGEVLQISRLPFKLAHWIAVRGVRVIFMHEVQRRLRDLLGLANDIDAFSELRQRCSAQESHHVQLQWEKRGPNEVLIHPFYRASIRPEGATMALHFTWSGGGSRILARNEPAVLRRRLEEILRAGGPHGGPADDDPPPEDPARRKYTALMHWEGPAELDRAWTHCFGAGYEARIRPIDGQHCLVVVSPCGTFTLQHFGLHLNMAGAANFYQRADDAYEEDFHSSSRPFHVRLRGVPLRLVHSPIPGLVGSVKTAVGQVYLCLIGVNDGALVLATEGAEPRCLARGRIDGLNGCELCPGEPPAVVTAAPDSYGRDDVAAAIGKLTALTPPSQEHLIALARASMIADGTREVRRFLWALVVFHEKGQHLDLCLDAEILWRQVLAAGGLPGAPGERTRRDALHWLAERSPLFERVRTGRCVAWLVRFSWFGKPTSECLASMTAMSGRLTAEAKPPRRRVKSRSTSKAESGGA